MRLKTNERVEPFKFDEVERPWGFYGVYSENEPNTAKILYIKSGNLLSLQWHFKRAQFYLLLDDNFIIEYSSKPVSKEIINEPDEEKRFKMLNAFLEENTITVFAGEGDKFGFDKLVVHRAHYLGDRKYGRILDVAFGENDEEDIIRIQDRYNRGNGVHV